MYRLRHRLDGESRFLRLPPEEKSETADGYAKRLESSLEDSARLILAAEHEGRLIGYVQADLDHPDVVRVALGVVESSQGLGIGAQLLAETEAWGARSGAMRIVMNVMDENHRASAMYRRRGYQPIGEASFTLYGSDEVVQSTSIAKLLESLGSI